MVFIIILLYFNESDSLWNFLRYTRYRHQIYPLQKQLKNSKWSLLDHTRKRTENKCQICMNSMSLLSLPFIIEWMFCEEVSSVLSIGFKYLWYQTMVSFIIDVYCRLWLSNNRNCYFIKKHHKKRPMDACWLFAQ